MIIKLDSPNLQGKLSLEECIYKRESVRKFQEKEIELEKISQLLWACQGKKGNKRTVPSAGATYPLEIYCTIKNKGYFHYDYEDHLLDLITEEDLSEELANASWNQDFICAAYINLIICANFRRTTQRYGDRGVRYVFIEVGHAAQQIHLEAVALGLGSVPIGAFEDKKLKDLLELPREIEPLYIIPIGYPFK